MAENNTKNFTSFPLESLKILLYGHTVSFFYCVRLYLKKSFTSKQYDLIAFSEEGTFSFSLMLKLCGGIFQEYNKEHKRFQLALGSERGQEIYKNFSFPSLVNEAFN